LVEVEVVVYSLFGRGRVGFVSLFGRGGLCLPRWRLYWLREEFDTPGCTNPPRWRFPRWESSGLEILHGGEGGDVELGARTSKQILLFAFDLLTL